MKKLNEKQKARLDLVDVLYRKMSLDDLLQMRSNLVDLMAVLDNYIVVNYPGALDPELTLYEVTGDD